MTGTVHDLLIATDELSGDQHRPERIVIRGIKVAYTVVRAHEAIAAREDPISANHALPIVFVFDTTIPNLD